MVVNGEKVCYQNPQFLGLHLFKIFRDYREHLSRRDSVASSAKSNHALKCNSRLVSLYFWPGIFTNVVPSFVVL